MADGEAADSVALVRGLLAAAEGCGVDAGRLVRDAEIPGWVLSAELPVMLPLRYGRSIWELTEHALETADAPLAMVSQSARGRHGLLDYLFATASTVREGLASVAEFLHLWTTNGRLRIETGDDDAATWSYHWRAPQGGRAEALASQFMVLTAMRGIRTATGRPVVPLEVTLAHDAPRSYRALGEMLGSARLHFGAPMTTIAFHPRDLDLPLRTADPVLADILTRHARSQPAAPLADWLELFRVRLAQALAAGTPTLAEVARRMTASTRTVQRRLAEHGTTWRAELESARRRLARESGADRTALARRLGYADARSVRRALWQWNGAPDQGSDRQH
jgi:AraC-like DNA-binding protein